MFADGMQVCVALTLGPCHQFVKGGVAMLGIPDFWIVCAYILCIVSAVLCVIYGVYNWNRGHENEAQQILEEDEWAKAEEEVEAKL